MRLRSGRQRGVTGWSTVAASAGTKTLELWSAVPHSECWPGCSRFGALMHFDSTTPTTTASCCVLVLSFTARILVRCSHSVTVPCSRPPALPQPPSKPTQQLHLSAEWRAATRRFVRRLAARELDRQARQLRCSRVAISSVSAGPSATHPTLALPACYQQQPSRQVSVGHAHRNGPLSAAPVDSVTASRPATFALLANPSFQRHDRATSPEQQAAPAVGHNGRRWP